MNKATDKIISILNELSESDYKDFTCRLMPDTDRATVLGVRIPKLRKLATELYKSTDTDKFLSDLPHLYHEEYLLHGFIIEKLRDFSLCVEQTEKLLPYISNWAVCDSISPKIFSSNTDKLMPHILNWLKSDHIYTVRFGIKQLMTHYLTDEYINDSLKLVVDVQSDKYYVNMGRAWFFATALAKQYSTTLPLLTENKLDKWTHNKTIQKAIESYRISPEQKAYLRTIYR